MKLYLAGGMSYRELLFGGAIMDLYLAIGGGQWNKYVAPALKEMGGVKRNENFSGSSRGRMELVPKSILARSREHKSKGEHP